ncbi:MAG: AarF/ABC1/UbiB kinase family protein, partial [Acidobacteriota bacterium]
MTLGPSTPSPPRPQSGPQGRDSTHPFTVPDPPKPGLEPAFEEYREIGPQGIVRRLLATSRHLTALALGGLAAHLRSLPKWERRRSAMLAIRMVLAILCLPIDRKLRRQPFPVQLRSRFERLGPTYIKLGQMLAMREDLLPRSVTDELKQLLDHVPAMPFARFVELVRDELGQPIEAVFAHMRSTPLASASIGQIHLATYHGGEQVVVKLVKPGVRAIVARDALLLRVVGSLLQLVFGRYQPKRVIREFCHHTLRETDLTREADNAETFAAAFESQSDIVFPKIHRQHSTENLLVMEYLDGIKPMDPRARAVRQVDRERLIDLGAEAIICMLFRDGFFHADLHPANLLILPGPKCGFIDLGMVGHFDTDLKRTLLYYYHALITGDGESAADYLAALAEVDHRSDPVGFRREVEDICRHWLRRSGTDRHSLAQLILECVARAGEHRMYFPLEMVLMVKAIVTFEAVGQMLLPGFDVATVSKRHVNRIFLQRFGPLRLAQESLTTL